MPRPTSPADATPVRVVVVTLDRHLANAARRAVAMLARELPGLRLRFHAAVDWHEDAGALDRARADIAEGDIILVSMLFMEDHIQAVLPALQARRDACDAMICCLSAGEVIRLSRMGGFRMDGADRGPLALLKRLRGSRDRSRSSGSAQMAMLRRLPRILRFVPGTAQDVRAYFLVLQYWLAGSDANVANMLRLLVDRYADGPRRGLRGRLRVGPPADYPDVGLYHPRAAGRITERLADLPKPAGRSGGSVGLLVMRSYILAGDTGHYDGVIDALERRGLAVVPAFSYGLDARPAAERYFMKDGRATVDAVVSLTGFSLVGGPAYNDARAAEELLAKLDVPYVTGQAVEFQTLDQWRRSPRGLMPVEATMMVAIPELDGNAGSIVFGGRAAGPSAEGSQDMQSEPERAEMLAARVARLVELRRKPAAERRVAVVLFNFPPNAGATGTAAHLAVFDSLFNTLRSLAAAGYAVELPASVAALREAVLAGNAERFGTDANVAAHVPVDRHVRRERWLDEIEKVWGPAPGRHQSDGRGLFVLGRSFGNVFVGVQPAFGYEGDPMRLLFEQGHAPTHAFCAFYRWLSEDFRADAVLHFGTHGALEFMPGKQAGLSAACWPDRLIGDLPNVYLYASNNPSEGAIARRRSAATLVSYLTPPVAQAGLYRDLLALKASVDRWRTLPPDAAAERQRLAGLIADQAAAADLAFDADADPDVAVRDLGRAVYEVESALIPYGLHVVGRPMPADRRADLLAAMAEAAGGAVPPGAVAGIVAGADPAAALAAAGAATDAAAVEAATALARAGRLLAEDHETPALLRALSGRYIRPAPGGDVLRTPDVLPTGRNLHGFDPFRVPSAFAVADGRAQAERLLARHRADGHGLPESVAMVLWGSDNLKSEGAQIAQALALMGARPRHDSYGRLAGAELVPLAELGRPRIDVVMTLSGIFRDLLPLQTRLLADAAFLAAGADEPDEMNFVARAARRLRAGMGCDPETAALRVFSNAEGAYGANVSQLVDSGAWEDEDELAETYSRRKSFAYGRDGRPAQQRALLAELLGGVQLAYQNLESVETGVTSLDHYFDGLGGIGRAVRRQSGADVAIYIGDQTRGDGVVRTLAEQVVLETRTRMLNPRWYEGMLEHGHEGVRQIEAHVTNTMGWSATTGQVLPWVYQRLTETYVLDEGMRERLARLNPKASARVVNRLIEAHERNYWSPDAAVLDALRRAGEELEDRLEGAAEEVAA